MYTLCPPALHGSPAQWTRSGHQQCPGEDCHPLQISLAEMERYSIQVTVVSPGYIRTNLSLNVVMEDGSKYGVLDKTTALGREPKDVAQVVLKAVHHRSKEVLLAGPLPTLAIYIRTLWPALFFKLMASRATQTLL
ncbi:unnamed protein product, partial [Coregonus sp. 'balchen']